MNARRGRRYGGVVKYIGSKRVLVPRILGLVGALRGVRTVADLFSGTSRVSHALKVRGYRVIANDHAAYAQWANRVGVEVPQLVIKDQQKRWGSCDQAGTIRLNWKVIQAKWNGFEAAFDGFDPGKCAFMDDDRMDALLKDTRIVRHGAKIASVRDNAGFLLQLREEGGVGRVLGGWPSTAYVDLLDRLKRDGSRLGGNTGQYAMRFLGRDGFILSRDVVARLVAEGVIDGPPASKRAMTAVQGAFNTWMDQSGRGLTQISRVLAMSL